MFQLGIYGGTFAPVHIGHMAAAEAFLKEADLDRLLIIPTRIPPHKQIKYKDDPSDRLKMLQIAFMDNPEYGSRLQISDYELCSPSPSYTVYTLRHYTEPNTRITFLCGTDMFLTLDSWKEPQEIFRLCRIALMLREESSTVEQEGQIAERTEFYKRKYGADIIRINAPAIEVSSSMIREGDDGLRKKYLHKAVYDYITEHKLYANNQ